MTRKKIVLHVGTDKTGSTAIQVMLFNNADALARHGYKYLEAGRFGDTNHTQLASRNKSNRLQLWRDLVMELDSTDCNGVVSFEGLYHLGKADWVRIRELLSGFDATIVIYLRRQSEMICSGIAQRIKTWSNQKPLSEYTVREITEIGHSYRPVLDKFAAAFGRECVLPRVYELSSFAEGNLFVDFAQSLGMSLDLAALERDFRLPDFKVNPTLDVESIRVLERLDRIGVEPGVRKLIVRLLLSMGSEDSSTFLDDETLDQVDEKFEVDNNEIAREWFQRNRLFRDARKFRFREIDPDRERRCFQAIEQKLQLEGNRDDAGTFSRGWFDLSYQQQNGH